MRNLVKLLVGLVGPKLDSVKQLMRKKSIGTRDKSKVETYLLPLEVSNEGFYEPDNGPTSSEKRPLANQGATDSETQLLGS